MTDDETLWVQEVFTHPTMKKYLTVMKTNDQEELLSLHSLDLKPKALKARHDFISGKAAVYSTLLSITKE
jgi:hypothetical protein